MAMKDAQVKDYYADPSNGVPECSTEGYAGMNISSPGVWSLLGENVNNEFTARRQTTNTVNNAVAADNLLNSGFYAGICQDRGQYQGPLQNQVSRIALACDHTAARDGYRPVERQNGINKLVNSVLTLHWPRHIFLRINCHDHSV